MEAAVRNAAPQNLKSIFEYSAKEMEQTFQVDWGVKEKLVWWIFRKQMKRKLSSTWEEQRLNRDTVNCFKVELTTGYSFYVKKLRIGIENISYQSCSGNNTRFKARRKVVAKIWNSEGEVIYADGKSLLAKKKINSTVLWSCIILIISLLLGSVSFLFNILFLILGLFLSILGLIQLRKNSERNHKSSWLFLILSFLLLIFNIFQIGLLITAY